jgi:predicted RNase H-like nuclease (RuvC/YqgF family)
MDGLKDNDGEYALGRYQQAKRTCEDARFRSGLYWVLGMDENETLDRLRAMSQDHKAEILNLETKIARRKAEEAEKKLHEKEAERKDALDRLQTYMAEDRQPEEELENGDDEEDDESNCRVGRNVGISSGNWEKNQKIFEKAIKLVPGRLMTELVKFPA